MSETSTETGILDQLKASFSAEIIESEVPKKNRVKVVIKPDSLLPIAEFAKENLSFEYLSSVVGIDMEEYFAAAYMLGSWSQGIMLEIYVRIDDMENPTLPSVTGLYKTADWHEREVFDLFGFHIEGHPDLKRILLPEEWDEFPHEDPNLLHPLRKAYKQISNPFKLIRPVDEHRGHIDIDKWRETIE
ncbi:MAG: NADH-quinone oxidoreductase subunit C [Candidatus Hodarchaeales archaeon]|jgi:NADH-quinone oxidoreductase subunit C